jgi:hypothetical protein
MFSEIIQDVQYSVKVIQSVLSGYCGLEWRTDDQEWEKIGEDEFPDLPYYVCAAFENGRHIPLPLLTGSGESEYPLQEAVLRFLSKRCKHTGLLRAFYRAVWDCAWYEHDFEEEYPRLEEAG